MKQPIIFIHIPKTAGTSLKEMLLQNFQPNQVFPNQDILNLNNGEYPSIKDIREKKYQSEYLGKQFFLGHYPWHIIKLFQVDKPYIISFLRDPVERTISHLRHLKMHHPGFRKKSLKEIFEMPELKYFQFDNLQTRFFMDNNPNRNITYDDLLKAKMNLEQCNYIGISEKYEESVTKICSLLNLNLSHTDKSNVFKKKLFPFTSKKDFSVDMELFLLIYKSNQFDIELYNLTKSKFEKNS